MTMPDPPRRRSALIFALDVTGGREVVYRVAVYLQDLARSLAAAPGLLTRARVDLLIFDAQSAMVVQPDNLLALASQAAGPSATGARFAPVIEQMKTLPFEGGGFHTFLLLTRTPADGWTDDVAPLQSRVGSVTGLCCGPDCAPEVAQILSKEPGGTRIVNPLDTIKKQFDSIGAWLMNNFADKPAPTPDPTPEPPPAEERPSTPPPGARWRVLEPQDRSDPVPHVMAAHLAGAPGWQMMGASRRGKLHAHEGSYREDSFALGTHGPWQLVAVADGAGSCRLSRVGAQVAVTAAIGGLRTALDRLWPGAAESDGTATLRQVIHSGIAAAHQAVHAEAERRAISVRDLSSTLLLVAFSAAPHPWLAAGQVGDGLVLTVGATDTDVQVVGAAEKGLFAGETVFLPSLPEREWDDHTWAMPADPLPNMILVMTDGVADDLVPLPRQAPVLIRGVRDVTTHARAEQALLETLAYEKRDSADDRTLAVIYRTEK